MVLAHRLAAQLLKAGRAPARRSIRRVATTPEIPACPSPNDRGCASRRNTRTRPLAAHRQVILRCRVHNHAGTGEVRVAVEVGSAEVREPGPAGLVDQGGVEPDDPALCGTTPSTAFLCWSSRTLPSSLALFRARPGTPSAALRQVAGRLGHVHDEPLLLTERHRASRWSEGSRGGDTSPHSRRPEPEAVCPPASLRPGRPHN